MRSSQPSPWTARRSDIRSIGAEEQALQESCAVAKDCCCCVKAILLFVLVARLQATISMTVNSTKFQTLAKANRGPRSP